ncbi:MAG: hypothetical protein HYX39_02685 [Bacteroidetes bacterium]|nr:hypothetical protein [Bacteroidota bacterium]
MKIITKRSILKLLITTLVISSLFTNCRKPKTVEVEKKIYVHDTVSYAWKADVFFNNQDQYILNAGFTDKYIFYYGPNANYRRDTSLNNNNYIQGTFQLYAPNYNDNWNYTYLPVLKDNFGINASSNKICIFNTLPGINVSSLFPNLKSIDTSFVSIGAGFNFIYSNVFNCSIYNRVLVSVISSQVNESHLCAFDILNNTLSYSITNTKSIVLLNGGGFVNTTPAIIGSIANRFLVYNSGSVYLIREDYSTKFLFNLDIYSVFKFQSNYYAVDGTSGIIYKSSDLGENWTQQYQVGSYMAKCKFIELDSKIISIRNDQIWQLDLQPTLLTVREINNSGLTGKTITNILKSNNKVIVTTLSGVYNRNSTDFYEFK